MGNIPNKVLELMRQEGAKYNPPSIIIGKVISNVPIIIGFNGIQIDKDNILLASDLIINSGDEVAMLSTLDKQTYVVLCKVVTPEA